MVQRVDRVVVVPGGDVMVNDSTQLERVVVVPGGDVIVNDSSPVGSNKSAAPPSPCWCCCCRLEDDVLLPPIYGSDGPSVPSFVGGIGGLEGGFAPRQSLDRPSCWILWLVGEAASTTCQCEYGPPLPLRHCNGKSSIGSAGLASSVMDLWFSTKIPR